MVNRSVYERIKPRKQIRINENKFRTSFTIAIVLGLNQEYPILRYIRDILNLNKCLRNLAHEISCLMNQLFLKVKIIRQLNFYCSSYYNDYLIRVTNFFYF